MGSDVTAPAEKAKASASKNKKDYANDDDSVEASVDASNAGDNRFASYCFNLANPLPGAVLFGRGVGAIGIHPATLAKDSVVGPDAYVCKACREGFRVYTITRHKCDRWQSEKQTVKFHPLTPNPYPSWFESRHSINY